jgi:hypothetical protein
VNATATAPPEPPATTDLDFDETAVAALRDLAVLLSVRSVDLFDGAVTPENLAVVAAAAVSSPLVPSAVPVLHLRNTADRFRALADVLDLWADKVERR